MDVSLPDGATPLPVYATEVDGDLLRTTGLRLPEGRDIFVDGRTGATASVIVNKPFADRYLKGAAIGRTLTIRRNARQPLSPLPGANMDAVASAGAQDPRPQSVTVAGVVEGWPTKERNDWAPTLYHGGRLAYEPAQVVYIRLREERADADAIIGEAVRRADPRVPIRDLASFETRRLRRFEGLPAAARIAGGFGLLAVLLAAAGLFSVLTFIVFTRA